MLLSQERLAELSGLSLRTIQRLEAGHTVSSASLRALALAVKTDVHVLAREFQAATPTDRGIDLPVVIRSLRERFWCGGPRPGRGDILLIEALCVGLAAMAFATSFLVSSGPRAAMIRVGCAATLRCGYLTAVFVRMSDRYRLWPGCENVAPVSSRTWRGVAAEHLFFMLIGTAGTIVAASLIVGH